MTVWPARRVKNKVLCGRRGEWGACRGVIAYVDNMDPSKPRAFMPPGMTVDFKQEMGGDDHWRPTARSLSQAARGQLPDGHGMEGQTREFDQGYYILIKNRRIRQTTFASTPFTRRCPEPGCGVLNRVTKETLDLLQST